MVRNSVEVARADHSPRARRTCLLAAGLLLAAVGCKDSADHTSDAGSDAGKKDSGPTWTRVYDEVLAANACDSPFCHGGAATGELNLMEDQAYDNLVGKSAAGKDCKGKTTKKRVEPGKPDQSLIMEKLVDPSCGLQMPPPPAEPATQEQIDLVRAWIAAGAKKN